MFLIIMYYCITLYRANSNINEECDYFLGEFRIFLSNCNKVKRNPANTFTNFSPILVQ